MSVLSILDTLFGNSWEFDIEMFGISLPCRNFILFLVFVFTIWFIARLCRFIYLRVKRLLEGWR